MKKYKLTTKDGTTHNGYQWSLPKNGKPGKWHEVSGEGELCSGGFLHFYHDPSLAALLNPIHAKIENPVLWEAEVAGLMKDDNGLKGGAQKMRLVRKMRLPKFALEQRIAFAIYCAQEVYKDEAFAKWACAYLDGADRSEAAAEAAAGAAARAAARAAEEVDLIACAKKAKAFKNF